MFTYREATHWLRLPLLELSIAFFWHLTAFFGANNRRIAGNLWTGDGRQTDQ